MKLCGHLKTPSILGDGCHDVQVEVCKDVPQPDFCFTITINITITPAPVECQPTSCPDGGNPSFIECCSSEVTDITQEEIDNCAPPGNPICTEETYLECVDQEAASGGRFQETL